ncbi:hypothetical protein [Halopseudomonas pelagia]|uniref:Uncharacterized protein n=1 Tax=Halopseudomonas pelagia TaxID=553151 RepID=A0AA91U121_9GAMM|nr:hypothetical protein [Halopseudomonas pelagia]PCC98518.1 hypothetical protein CO192_15210 [Halopseudomonas pelagia]QFY57460.1 hypothetical protein EAO82_14435 [Halopseudomonas pelagia]
MSLSSLEQRVIILGRTQVGLFRLGANGPQEIQRVVTPADATPTSVLIALAELLRQNAAARCRLQVLISSHLVRFMLVPWREEIASPRELLSFAQFCFEQVYVEEPHNWSFSVSPEAKGRSRIAAATSAELISGLQELSKETGCRLLGVQPYLATVFNRFCRNLADQSFLFIAVEQGRVGVLRARDGQWQSVHTLACADTDNALAELIAREQQLLELRDEAVQAVYVHGSAASLPKQTSAGNGCTLHRLGQEGQQVDQQAEPVDPMLLMARAVH